MANRRDEKQARREERLRLERERQSAEQRRQRIGYIVASLLVLATVGVVAFVLVGSGSGSSAPAKDVKTLKSAAAAAGCSVRTFPSEGRDHVTGPVKYKTNPPTSGPHDQVPAPDGEYSGAPAKEHFVHTLEHGRVELQYRPGASAAARAGLKAVFAADSNRMLLFPNNTSMPYEVAATAWTHMLACPHYDAQVPAAMTAFRDAYRGRGPEQIP